MKPLGRRGSQAGGSAPWAADRSSEAHFSVEADGVGGCVPSHPPVSEA